MTFPTKKAPRHAPTAITSRGGLNNGQKMPAPGISKFSLSASSLTPIITGPVNSSQSIYWKSTVDAYKNSTKKLIKSVVNAHQFRVKSDFRSRSIHNLYHGLNDFKSKHPKAGIKENPIDAGNKMGGTMTGSVGVQAAYEFKLLGVGLGYDINFGSVDFFNSSIDLLKGIPPIEIPGISTTQIVFKQGGSVTLAAYSIEGGNEYTYNYKEKWYEHKTFGGAGIAPFKITIEEIERYEYDTVKKDYVKVASRTNPLFTFGDSHVKVGYGVKGEIKGEFTVNIDGAGRPPRPRTHVMPSDVTRVQIDNHVLMNRRIVFYKWSLLRQVVYGG